jgi:uncharacterized phage protein (TIGR02218 family)
VIQGFTEHDRDLVVNGLTYLASSGFNATQVSQTLGLSVDNLDVQGAISSDTINEDDLANGVYDGAEVTLLWVNWADPTMYQVLSRGFIGEVKRQETAFSAEFRSLSQKLAQKTGRTYQRTCDAVLGDNRCKVNLASPIFQGTGSVTSASGRDLVVSGLGGYADDWFTHGLLTFTSGSNNGLSFEVKHHSGTSIQLWEVPPSPVLSMDTFSITAGCKQDLDTCRDKFNNLLNFQGFPYVPGNDRLLQYPLQGEGEMDGGSLFN